MQRQLRTGIAAAAALATGACQTYARVARTDIAPGGIVRADLTDRGSESLTYQLGPRVSRIEGRVRERDSASVLVSVTQLSRVGSQEESWPGDTVRLTTDATSGVQLRRFSGARSALLFGVITVGAALAARAIGESPNVGGRSGGVPVGTH